MKLRNLVMMALMASLGLLNVRAIKAEDATERVEESSKVLKEIMAAPDKGIPRDLLSKAHCVAIIPALKKGGFVVGAQYGKGVITCRTTGEARWTGPSTIRIEGGSFGRTGDYTQVVRSPPSTRTAWPPKTSSRRGKPSGAGRRPGRRCATARSAPMIWRSVDL